MRKKFSKIVKKALALGLSLGMLASTTVFADVNSQGQNGVDTKVEFADYTYDVILPTTYNVAIDQYQKYATTKGGLDYLSQIYTSPFLIINASDIPVKVTMYPYIETTSGASVNVVTGTASVSTGSSTSKDLFIEARPISAASITRASIVSASATTGASNASNTGAVLNPSEFIKKNDEDTVKYISSGYTLSDGTVSSSAVSGFSFILNKADYTDFGTPASGSVLSGSAFTEKQVAGFKLIGALNNNADWKTGDFGVKVVYDLKGYSQKDYTENATGSVLNANILTSTSIKVASLGAVGSTKTGTLESGKTVTYKILDDDLKEEGDIGLVLIYSNNNWVSINDCCTISKSTGYHTITINDDNIYFPSSANGTYKLAFTDANNTKILYGGLDDEITIKIDK